MHTLSSALVICALAALSSAVQVSIADTNITAGTDFEVTILNTTETPDKWDPPISSDSKLQIGLRTTVYNWWMCSLSLPLPLNTETSKVTIPSSIGPSGAYYQLTARILRSTSSSKPEDPYLYGSWGPQIFLSNGSSAWSPAEITPYLDDMNLGLEGYDRADIPCGSYDCARECAGRWFPDEQEWGNGTTGWMECLRDCEGVKIDEEKVDVRGNRTVSPTRVEVVESVPTPRGGEESCKVEDFRTACGGECCGYSMFCMGFVSGKCEKLPGYCGREGGGDEGEFVKCESKEEGEGGKSGAVVLGVQWRVVVLSLMAAVVVEIV